MIKILNYIYQVLFIKYLYSKNRYNVKNNFFIITGQD